MSGRRSRIKGSRAENEFFTLSNELCKDIDWPYRDKSGRIFMRHPAPRHCEGQSDNHDTLGVLPVSIEVKRHETLALPKWIKQAKEQARDTQIPVLAYRQNNMPWTVLPILTEETWGEFLTWKLGNNHETNAET